MYIGLVVLFLSAKYEDIGNILLVIKEVYITNINENEYVFSNIS